VDYAVWTMQCRLSSKEEGMHVELCSYNKTNEDGGMHAGLCIYKSTDER